MAEFVPAILESDITAYQWQLELLSPWVHRVQVDFADQSLVANQTISPDQLPATDQPIELEAHLMVNRPSQYFPALHQRGYTTVALHAESSEDIFQLIPMARGYHFQVGLVLNPTTNIAEYAALFSHRIVDFVQLMGVEPGHGGQQLLPQTLVRLAWVREVAPDAIIAVDGGVRLDNARSLLEVGANRLVVGKGGWLMEKEGSVGNIVEWRQAVVN